MSNNNSINPVQSNGGNDKQVSRLDFLITQVKESKKQQIDKLEAFKKKKELEKKEIVTASYSTRAVVPVESTNKGQFEDQTEFSEFQLDLKGSFFSTAQNKEEISHVAKKRKVAITISKPFASSESTQLSNELNSATTTTTATTAIPSIHPPPPASSSIETNASVENIFELARKAERDLVVSSLTHPLSAAAAAAGTDSIGVFSSSAPENLLFRHLQPTREDLADRLKLKAIYESAAELWRENVCTDWCRDASGLHICRSVGSPCPEKRKIKETKRTSGNSKEIERAIQIHASCEICFSNKQNTCDIDQFIISVYDVTSDDFHICNPQICSSRDPALHANLWRKIDCIYMCRQTGAIHVCDKNCKARKFADSEKHFMVCSISGMTNTESSNVITVSTPAWATYSSTVEKNQSENENARGGGGDGISDSDSEQDISTKVQSRRKRKMTIAMEEAASRSFEEIMSACTTKYFVESVIAQQIKHENAGGRGKTGASSEFAFDSYIPIQHIKCKQDALVTAISHTALTFSVQRFKQFEKRKIHLGQLLEQQMDRSISRSHQDKCVPNATSLLLEMDKFQKKNYVPPNTKKLAQDDHVRGLLIHYYAQQVVIFWYILCTHTPFLTLGSFQFKHYIDSAMALFEEGITVAETREMPGFTLIRKHALLAILSSNKNGSSSRNRGNSGSGVGVNYKPSKQKKGMSFNSNVVRPSPLISHKTKSGIGNGNSSTKLARGPNGKENVSTSTYDMNENDSETDDDNQTGGADEDKNNPLSMSELPGRLRKQRTQIKTQIKRALNMAIMNGVSPQTLKIENYLYNDIEDSFFVQTAKKNNFFANRHSDASTNKKKTTTTTTVTTTTVHTTTDIVEDVPTTTAMAETLQVHRGGGGEQKLQAVANDNRSQRDFHSMHYDDIDNLSAYQRTIIESLNTNDEENLF